MARRTTVLLGLLVLGGAAAAHGGNSGSTRVVDRTFRCTPVAVDTGSRFLEVVSVPARAVEAGAADPGQSPSPGFIGVSSGAYGPNAELVSVRARLWQRYGGAYSFEGVYARVRRCVSSSLSPQLSAEGLKDRPVQYAEQFTCASPGDVIVRVRATLRSPGPWLRLSASFDGTRRKVDKAALAVRSARTSKPVAYLELDRYGKTKLWRAANCTT